jgi:hypothetical protein
LRIEVLLSSGLPPVNYQATKAGSGKHAIGFGVATDESLSRSTPIDNLDWMHDIFHGIIFLGLRSNPNKRRIFLAMHKSSLSIRETCAQAEFKRPGLNSPGPIAVMGLPRSV